MFKKGVDLRNGLIDINKVYQLIQQKQAAENQRLPYERNLTEKDKWQRVVKFMGENPSFLLDAIPSSNMETYSAFMQS